MTTLPVPESLPTLPNLTDLRNDAQKVVDYWTGVRDEAERRRAQAQVTPNGPGRLYSHRLTYESGWSANYNLDDTVRVITPDEVPS